MKHFLKWTCLAVAAAFLVSFVPARAGDDKTVKKPVVGEKIAKQAVEKPPFIRVTRNKDNEPRALQTSIVRYVPTKGKSGVVVDLIGAVHIADRAYYYRLNDRFENYDVVLYELVAPKGAIPRPGKSDSSNPIALLQKAMTVLLGLDHQTKCIDYTCTNFVHADLTPNEMMKAMEKRGDSPLTLAISVAADILRQQNLAAQKQKNGPAKQLDFDPLAMFSDPKGPSKLKRFLALQMEQMGDGAGLGKTLNTILVADRNAACMKVFQKQLVAGKKKIAIFYGAAHMPDFERRLVQDFGMRRQNVEWISAWDLRLREFGMLDLLKGLSP